MGDLPGSGATAELKPVASYSKWCAGPNSFGIGTETWAAADRAAREIIRNVQPTPVSEQRRRAVIGYIQRLIRNCLGAELFPYGSVPLKTYLPDGDIDLTAFGGANVEDTLAEAMKSIFVEEERNMAAEFVVKDVQLIRAEVKLVKCIVQDVVVDISFNQIGGLCTLCFLEQVDRFIGKDHLFKRSIILIKAWCYYESRILGAHHGLISTYALETLVLYIFNLFHSSLDGPLAVLYKFLHYFSKFDWDTYCISLTGPIRLSSLPSIIVEMPKDSDGDLLLSSDFLSSCVGLFSVPSRGSDRSLRGFQQKHLNIVDPLKETNNLGRSVSKGNFYRIRSAFSYGARNLERILLQPEDSIANELHMFFTNSVARHDTWRFDLDTSLICNSPISAVPITESALGKIGNFHDKFDEYAISSGYNLLKETEEISDVTDRDQLPKLHSLNPHFCGDSTDLATSRLGGLKISPDLTVQRAPVPKQSGVAVVKPYFAPHLYFPSSNLHNRNMRDGNLDLEKDASSFVVSGSDEGIVTAVQSLDENHLVDKDEPVASSKPEDVFWAPKSFSFSGDPDVADLGQGSAIRSERPESLNSLDLSGDYNSYLQCLQYGRWWYDYGLGMHSLPMPPLPTTLYKNNSLWEGVPPLSHHKQNGFSHRFHNGFHPSPPLYPVPPILLPGAAVGWEEGPKPRGTGTYFPNMIQPPLGYRSSSMKGRTQASSRSPHNNGRNMIFVDPNMLERSSHEPSQPQVPIEKTLMVGSPDSYLPFTPLANGYHPNSNGLFIQLESILEFQLVGNPPGTPVSEKSRQPGPVLSSSPRNLLGVPRSQPALGREQDRISLKSSYRLKDEDDFPPLPL